MTVSLDGLLALQEAATTVRETLNRFVFRLYGDRAEAEPALTALGELEAAVNSLPLLIQEIEGLRDRLEKLEAVAEAARECIEVLEPLERDLWPSQEAAAVALRDALAALDVPEQKETE